MNSNVKEASRAAGGGKGCLQGGPTASSGDSLLLECGLVHGGRFGQKTDDGSAICRWR